MIKNLNHRKSLSLPVLGLTALVGIALVVLIVGARQMTAGAQVSTPGVNDPLSLQETQQGLELLDQAIQSGSLNEYSVTSSSASAENEERTVVLLFERHLPAKKGTQETNKVESASGAQKRQRQGEGYVYSYSTDTLHRSLINLETGETEKIESVQGVQLPLVPVEEEAALSIIRNDSTAWKTLQQAYYETTDTELQNFDQLEKKILIFMADAMPDRVTAESAQCGVHRCAQVLLFTKDRFAFEMSPIVDLSTQSVVQMLERQ